MKTVKAACAAALLIGALSGTAPAAPGADRGAPPMLQTTNRTLSPVVEARREVADAKSDLGRYRQVVNKKRLKLEYALTALPEYREALAARNKAKAAYGVTARPVLQAVRATEEHKRVKAQWVTANDMAGAAIGGGSGALAELRSIREDLVKHVAALKAMEEAAISADAKAAEAKAALDEAEAKLAALRERNVDDQLEADPAYASAAEQVEAAQARLDTATANLAKLAQESKDAREQARLAYMAEQEALRQARLAAPS